MLDFRRAQSPPPFLNRRAQLRLMLLVALLGFVLLAIRSAAEPSTWYWLLGNPVERMAAEKGGGDIDRESPPDRFDDPSADRDASSSGAESPLPRTLDRALLKGIEDNALVLASEREAYFQTLAVAASGAGGTVARPEDDATFASLFVAPAGHRGEPLALRGHLRRVTQFDAGENRYGFEKLYEAWLFTPESGTNPYVVVCTAIPEGMPRGDGILEEVRVVGYFFKKYKYRAGDGMRLAPLVLAGPLTWVRQPASAPLNRTVYLAGLALVGVAGLVVSVWLFARSHARFVTPSAERLAGPSRDELDALRELESPEETFPA